MYAIRSYYVLSPYRLKEDVDLALEEGFAMISSTPAKLANLEDRGEVITSYSIHYTKLYDDDDCEDKLNTLKQLGVTFSEFPLSVEVAKKAKELNISTGMGAPNVVRGGSQSGNIAARELVKVGVCDYLCSDYHPASLLLSPYRLT